MVLYQVFKSRTIRVCQTGWVKMLCYLYFFLNQVYFSLSTCLHCRNMSVVIDTMFESIVWVNVGLTLRLTGWALSKQIWVKATLQYDQGLTEQYMSKASIQHWQEPLQGWGDAFYKFLEQWRHCLFCIGYYSWGTWLFLC